MAGKGLGPLGAGPSASTDDAASTDDVDWQGTDSGLWGAGYDVKTNDCASGASHCIVWTGQHPGDYYIFWKGRNDYLYEAYYNSSTHAWSRIAFPHMGLLG
ncbi:MAG TPA: hypothetical protein VGH27_24195 [Streptosporangiaceae bacterium]|jgi:hypothetical protein